MFEPAIFRPIAKNDELAMNLADLGLSAPLAPIQPMKPPGLEAILTACQELYPDQPNPLQVTALVKYWLGGPDPLDYISMYSNKGDPARGISPHWHYISFGLSDLHGDGRVHEPGVDTDQSGFGFELTFRLKREPGETSPPTWPATLMQALARYVFNTDNQLCSGDHIPWNQSLDQSESRIQHMLMSEDAQLPTVTSPFGIVQFIQIVGVCEAEMKAAQHWNGPGILELIRCVHVAGGPWLVTDMRRGETIFELDPGLQECVDRGIETEGSNLSGVSSRCLWEQGVRDDQNSDPRMSWEHLSVSESFGLPRISEYDSDRIRMVLAKGLSSGKPPLPSIRSVAGAQYRQQQQQQQLHKQQHFIQPSKPRLSGLSVDESLELTGNRVLDSVNLIFDMESAELLPLAIRGRLRHSRHFTFKSVIQDCAITLMTPGVVGAIVSESTPYATHGGWLQVLVTDDFLDTMIFNIEEELCTETPPPRVISWPERHLSITIIPDD